MTLPRQYQILQVLGAGGFGTVYRARYLGEGGFSKEVALKVLNANMDGVAEIAERLRDEARMLGLLRHRAIVHVDRLTQLAGRWAVVMEYVEGVSLGRLLRRGPLPPGAALEIAAEVAGALHVAYTRPGPHGEPLRLFHRDIKPANLQITPFGEVKVLDFGIARAEFESREARTRSIHYGTPEYMSPERLDLHGDGPEGDVYALGVLLFEMLSGRRFGRSSALRERHEPQVRAAIDALAAVPDVGEEALALIALMLDWAPEARPKAGEVERRCVRLRNQLTDEPLRLWAERVVQPLLAMPVRVEEEPSEAGEDLSGSILIEVVDDLDEDAPDRALPDQAPPEVVPPPPEVPRPSPSKLPLPEAPRPGVRTSDIRPLFLVFGAILLFALLVAGGGAASLAWLASSWDPQSEPGVIGSGPATPPSEPAPVPLPEAAPRGEPTVVTASNSSTPSIEVQEARSGTGSSSNTADAARRTEPTGAQLTLTGDAEQVVLQSSTGRSYTSNQRLPAGTYRIHATFDGQEPVGAGSFVVGDEQAIHLNCQRMFRMCQVKP